MVTGNTLLKEVLPIRSCVLDLHGFKCTCTKLIGQDIPLWRCHALRAPYTSVTHV